MLFTRHFSFQTQYSQVYQIHCYQNLLPYFLTGTLNHSNGVSEETTRWPKSIMKHFMFILSTFEQ